MTETVARLYAIPTFVAAIGASEVVLVFGNLAVGILGHAIVVVTVLVLQARWSDTPHGRALVPLVLVPVLRILSLTMALPGLPAVTWLVLAGVPLAIGGLLAARALGLGPSGVGLRVGAWLPQAGIALLGIPAGLAIWVAGGPRGFADDLATPLGMVSLVVLAAGAGVIEEFIFRGVIQGGLSLVLGWPAVWLGAILYGTVYLASLSPGIVVVMTALGLVQGLLVARSGSIAGVSVGHALAAATALVVWPALLG